MLSHSHPFEARLRALTSGFCLTAFFINASPVQAGDSVPESTELPEIVVGATRLPTPENELGTSVSVITSDEIAVKQERTLPDTLLDVPELNVVQTGGPGGVASVFIRGTNSNQTKVFSTELTLVTRVRRTGPLISPKCSPLTSAASRSCVARKADSTVRTRSVGSSISSRRAPVQCGKHTLRRQ